MIKMICIDLDGTLFGAERVISAANKAALAEAKRQGVKVVITTGRPLKSIEVFLKELDLLDDDDYSITFNGGLVQRNGTGEVLRRQTVSVEDIKAMHEAAFALELPVDVIAEDKILHIIPQPQNHPSMYYQVNPQLAFGEVPVSEIDPNGVYNKMVITADEAFLDQQLALVPQNIHERLTLIKSRPFLLEVMPFGVHKAKGIQELEKLLGIKREEVMAIGDEANDLTMIQYAGLGVAMGNATDEVKAAADVMTETNILDGVAQAVQQYVLK